MKRLLSVPLVLLTLAAPQASRAEPAAATICPPMSFPSTQNLAVNADFEIMCSPNPVNCQGVDNCNPPPSSAAANWKMHTDNSGSKITTRCVPSKVPEKGGKWMLQVNATGGESGLLQLLGQSTARRMLSVWVRVRSGQVGI